ncbi:fumarylacetoacetate hydrolase family protein [Mangrovivirga cuniculi]|uniref:2-hydroxyhepta-2,4-diene-1,7-dioate isomerase n=1 Tax=Mangrovivirga cuniculi TaxID=2715131 RepID=A0A4D7JR28_9BACT|nr:fumarylacetoacetate hydrolase family protein [Mangrovivirga cuniculi]QCK15970.1 2-hydroxyhepta-2,4-diene-1,7-dioate isomerase [Mangrovivirga cuniculi]
MKILAIGRNYVDHIKELNNEIPEDPVIFTKPDTALLKNNDPFYYPDYSNDIHHEIEVIIKICKQGKSIQPKFAHKYYDAVGLGIDFTARDIQSKAKSKGLPWAIAKGFNGSAPISEFIPKSEFKDLQDLNFELQVNGETKQKGNTSLMMYKIDELLAHISKYITLSTGDIIFTGTPKGVGPVKKGDRLTGFLEGKKMLDFEIK